MDLPKLKKRGRPPTRTVKAGERVPLSLRVTPQIKKQIDQASASSGRSQSQEVEFRIERSFDREHLLNDALALRHGPYGAAVLMAVSHAQQMVTMLAGQAFAKEGHQWIVDGPLDDPRYFDAVAKAINLVLRALHPTNPVGTGWKRPPVGARLQWKEIPVLAAEVAVIQAIQIDSELLPGKWRSK